MIPRHFRNGRSSAAFFFCSSRLPAILASCHEIDQGNRATALLRLPFDRIPSQNRLSCCLLWWFYSSQCDQGRWSLDHIYKPILTCHSLFQVIDKNNKRLKGSNPSLTHRRLLFERVRTFWTAKKGVWCAVDIESWERDHTVLTEFGWSTIGWKDGERFEENGHLIVDEARKYTNSQYVPDHRYVSKKRFEWLSTPTE